jgi:hypothetical protein
MEWTGMAELLVDEGIGQNLIRQLRGSGLNAFHTLEYLPNGSSDSLIFLEAQRRGLTVFTWNHKHFTLLAAAWRDCGLGDHHGIITRSVGKRQLLPQQTLVVLDQYCRDPTSYANQIELF